MFKKELIFLDTNFNNKEELFKFCTDKLYAKGYVYDNYKQNLIKREENFPTGIKTECKINLAIPHTDAQFAKKECVLFVRNKNFISFNNMDGSEENVEVKLIFNLVLKNPDNQIDMLMKLMNLFKDKKLLKLLLTENNEDNIHKILNQKLEVNNQ